MCIFGCLWVTEYTAYRDGTCVYVWERQNERERKVNEERGVEGEETIADTFPCILF